MRLVQETLSVPTKGRRLYDVTAAVASIVQKSGIDRGLCHVFVRHTSASLVVQENADPSVLRDLERWMEKLAPVGAHYEHDDEGPDDMPAHLRASVTRTSESVPVTGGRLALGTWQAIYLWEHRTAAHDRTLIVTIFGEG